MDVVSWLIELVLGYPLSELVVEDDDALPP